MGLAIGIDLGTTNSCAAIMENGRPRVLTYKGGDSTIPSVFAIDDKGNRLVGAEAKRQDLLRAGDDVLGLDGKVGREEQRLLVDALGREVGLGPGRELDGRGSRGKLGRRWRSGLDGGRRGDGGFQRR